MIQPQATKNYSLGSIQTIHKEYLKMNRPQLLKDLIKEKALGDYLTEKSTQILKEMNEMIKIGIRENEAWEIASNDYIYN